MSARDTVRNLGLKAARRLASVHKPILRLMRRTAREQEHRGYRREAAELEREIAQLASGSLPIIAGPWLAEVGYEVLYWIPFLRWLRDAHAVRRDRLIVLSRGGMETAYRDVAGTYLDIFDLTTPQALAARNAQRRVDHEDGGQKQSAARELDQELLRAARARLGLSQTALCHPSLMFRLFRHVWHGTLPMDVLWRHARYATIASDPVTVVESLPDDFIAVKLYAGPALTASEATSKAVRSLVAHAASIAPVVVLETDLGVDEHRDFDLHGIAGVTSASSLMTARTNLSTQIALIARARFFMGTCGGLAWLAPFLGVPTVAVYEDDRLLVSHLLIARQAGALAGAAEFAPMDLRALARTGVLDALRAGTPAAPQLE